MKNFDDFKNAVLEDMGLNQPLDGFRDLSLKIGGTLFQYSHPSVRFFYIFSDEGWFICCGRGSTGRGATLAEAHDDEDDRYKASHEKFESTN